MGTAIVVILLVLIIFAAVATLLIGNSKQNKEGNPDYDKRSGANTLRLTLFYVVATIVSCIALIWYITS